MFAGIMSYHFVSQFVEEGEWNPIVYTYLGKAIMLLFFYFKVETDENVTSQWLGSGSLQKDANSSIVMGNIFNKMEANEHTVGYIAKE